MTVVNVKIQTHTFFEIGSQQEHKKYFIFVNGKLASFASNQGSVQLKIEEFEIYAKLFGVKLEIERVENRIKRE